MIYDFKLNIVRNNNTIGTLSARRCNIAFDSTKEVKRTCRVEIKPESDVISKGIVKVDSFMFDGLHFFNANWTFAESKYAYVNTYGFNMFTDRIQPVLIIENKEYPLGLFMIISNPEYLSDTLSYYDLEAYDETMILKQACTTERLYYPVGTQYTDIVENMLIECNLTNYILDPNNATLTTDREFDIGTPYIEIINQLLEEINYNHVYADSKGVIHIESIQSKVIPDFNYNDINAFNTKKPIVKNTDIYDLPNVLIGTASNPDIDDVLYYKRENNDVASQISIINRGYKVVKHFNFSNIASQDVLEEYIDRMYLESTQATETIEFDSKIEPNHEYESYILVDTDLIHGFYIEKAWELELSSRATMHHLAERKVYV